MPKDGRKLPIAGFVPVGVSGGVETKVDPNLVQSPQTLQSDNVRLTTLGAARKRYGTTQLIYPGDSTFKVPTVALGMTHNEVLLQQTNGNVYATGVDQIDWRLVANSGPTLQLDTLPVSTSNSLSTSLRGTSFSSNMSYAVVGDIGVLAYQFQYNKVSSGSDQAGITLVGFNTITGSQLWTTSFSQVGTPASNFYVLGSGFTLTKPATFNPTMAYNGQFYLLFKQYGQFAVIIQFEPVTTQYDAPNIPAGQSCSRLDGQEEDGPCFCTSGNSSLLADIADSNTYPLYVTAGNGELGASRIVIPSEEGAVTNVTQYLTTPLSPNSNSLALATSSSTPNTIVATGYNHAHHTYFCKLHGLRCFHDEQCRLPYVECREFV